jgi:hypothetical protein
VTLQTADAVKPHQPSLPTLVTIFTPAANRAMPFRNVLLSTGVGIWDCAISTGAGELVIATSIINGVGT